MYASALACAGALWLAVPHAAPAAEPLAGSRPNIILILADDQGYGDASCNGNPVLKTPGIDRLFAEAVHFEDFHVSPTCSPTRSAIMSGKHEFKNGVTHTIYERERMSLKTTTLAQTLRAAGYTTGVFGKWHLGDEDAYQPGRRGFDEVFIHGGGGIGQTFLGSCGDAPGNSYFDPVVRHNGTFVKTAGYCTEVFFRQALKWIETVRSATNGVAPRPFFVYLTPNVPHAPLECPPAYARRYAGKVPANVAKYFGMLANLDDQVSRLLDQLQTWGLEKHTLVIYMNDNGGTAGCELFNAGMRGRKGSAHNGGTRTLSLWRWPGTLAPARCDRLAAHVDIFPTLAALAGAKPSEGLDGFSLVPLLENPEAPWHPERMLFTHVGRWPVGAEPVKYGDCSVRWQRYLLVRERKPWALYDLAADPGEKTNLAAQHADIVAKLDQAYDRWWADVRPCMENEHAYQTAPTVNPFKAAYEKQFKGPRPP